MEIIKLNLIPSGVNPTCHCSQYDNGRVIRIDLFDGLTPYVLQSGDTVTLNVRKPDNTIVTTSLTATQGNTYVNLVTTEQICACVGYNLCDLTIANGSTVIGTLNFIMQIERDVLADGIPSQSVIEDLDERVQEAVGDNYYTKTETDDLLDAKADKSTTYTKTEIDTALTAKADKSTTYTKTEVNSALALKANSSDIDELDKKIDYISDKTGLEYSPIIPFTDGRSINFSTGGTNANTAKSYTDGFIYCEGYEYIRITMVKNVSSGSAGIAFYSSTLQSSYISGVRENYNASSETYEERTIEIPTNARYFRTTWFSSNNQYYSDFSCVLIKAGTLDGEIANLENKINVVTDNVLDIQSISDYIFINLGGNINSSDTYAATDYIKVKENDIVALTFGAVTKLSSMRYVTAYNSSKIAVSSLGAENITTFTVPAGVSYVRVSANRQILKDPYSRISLTGNIIPYQSYYNGEVGGLVKQDHTNLDLFRYYPLSALPKYFVNTLAYRALGVLSKGYICLISDDGNAGLATYTIPMIIDKNVPCTFAVMKESECWVDPTNKATVLDAVENHNCILSQHGGKAWTHYDELLLNSFFDSEKAYWDSLGVSVYGAVCPQHEINDMIRAVAGGRFGVLRTGYTDGAPYYDTYMNGARSNIYGLSSQSTLDGDLSSQCAKLDYCKANNLLRILHWHENELNAAKKAQLEGIIDYAKSINLTFVTLKDIPNLI